MTELIRDLPQFTSPKFLQRSIYLTLYEREEQTGALIMLLAPELKFGSLYFLLLQCESLCSLGLMLAT